MQLAVWTWPVCAIAGTAEVAQQRVKALLPLAVGGVALGAVGVETDVGVEAHRLGMAAARKLTQHFVAHAVAAVTGHVGDINVDTDAGIVALGGHGVGIILVSKH